MSDYGDTWTDHDSSWVSYCGLWVINYSAVFVSVLAWLAVKKFKNQTFTFVTWVLSLLMVFIALSAGLSIIYDLKLEAVYNYAYSHLSTWNYNVRYAFMPFMLLLIGMLSVSYTHLDVYKRQVQVSP